MGIEGDEIGNVSGPGGLTDYAPSLTAQADLTASSTRLTGSTWLLVLILHTFPCGTIGL
jgi:hypothetical protein